MTHAAVPVLTAADHADIDAVESADAGDDTSSRLVHAAAEVFAERGYDKAGVAEIARRAGLTTGAIYSRFSGKAELLAEAIRLHTSDEFDRLFAQHRFQGRATDLLEDGRFAPHHPGSHARPGHPPRGVRRRPARPRGGRGAAGPPGVWPTAWPPWSTTRRPTASSTPALDDAVVHFAHAVGLGFLLFEAVGAAHPSLDGWEDLIAPGRRLRRPAHPTRPIQPPTPTPPGATP